MTQICTLFCSQFCACQLLILHPPATTCSPCALWNLSIHCRLRRQIVRHPLNWEPFSSGRRAEHKEASQARTFPDLVQIMCLETSESKILYPREEKWTIKEGREWSCANVTRNRAKTICNPGGRLFSALHTTTAHRLSSHSEYSVCIKLNCWSYILLVAIHFVGDIVYLVAGFRGILL
uniref:Secreted protein n=1 Tax=Ixodes ricinus TaxID=34613 RepID=A0A6B0UZU5_IXORI